MEEDCEVMRSKTNCRCLSFLVVEKEFKSIFTKQQKLFCTLCQELYASGLFFYWVSDNVYPWLSPLTAQHHKKCLTTLSIHAIGKMKSWLIPLQRINFEIKTFSKKLENVSFQVSSLGEWSDKAIQSSFQTWMWPFINTTI